jgi:hypothetical protein
MKGLMFNTQFQKRLKGIEILNLPCRQADLFFWSLFGIWDFLFGA